jgi:glycosyltransferase involved in cell wall biosynthesis
MQKNKIIFLIRAYNEASRIMQVIEGILDAGYDQILVVDDGSTDGTESLLSHLREKNKIHFVRQGANRGAGAALETGFAYIRATHDKNNWKYLVTFDAD